LRARHHHFRNTGFAFRQCAQKASFSHPSQLKDPSDRKPNLKRC
ncbi:hypothetical protein, partial [Escherichia coli]